jgi:hypothetical protein
MLLNTTKDFELANEFHCLALSILFDRPIYVFTNTGHQHEYNANNQNKIHYPIILLHVKNHFMPLLPCSSGFIPPKPNFNQFEKFNLDEFQ